VKVPYHQLETLEHVYLEDSFVLGISETEGVTTFALEVVLLPAHPGYGPPRPGEAHCFRRASLVLVGERRWGERHAAASFDAEGGLDLGNIDAFSYDESTGVTRLEGYWGSLEVASAKRPVLSLGEGEPRSRAPLPPVSTGPAPAGPLTSEERAAAGALQVFVVWHQDTFRYGEDRDPATVDELVPTRAEAEALVTRLQKGAGSFDRWSVTGPRSLLDLLDRRDERPGEWRGLTEELVRGVLAKKGP
jgi:hypothetical protein